MLFGVQRAVWFNVGWMSITQAIKFSGLSKPGAVARKAGTALRGAWYRLRRRFRRPLAGEFQPYNHTLPDRYPWLFRFAAEQLRGEKRVRLLSFGCSRGEEVFALRRYFPDATITGIDIDPQNIAICEARTRTGKWADITFVTAATSEGEQAESYDAIFCLAVLCHGDLTTFGAQRSDPLLRFDDFERTVEDLARCLKNEGLLLLLTTNFRFCDTATARDFDVVLEADREQLAPDVIFDRDNRLMKGERYCAVAFRKRSSAVHGSDKDPNS
jgi:SAM-dependent methyltransferase